MVSTPDGSEFLDFDLIGDLPEVSGKVQTTFKRLFDVDDASVLLFSGDGLNQAVD